MTLDDLLLLGEQMQRWQARIDNGEAGDWPHPETATFVRAAQERIPALRAELAEAHEALTAQVVERRQIETERDGYRAMLADVLAAAHPHPVDHPTMADAWERARQTLRTGVYKASKEADRG